MPTRKKSARTASSRGTDAIALLKADHAKVEGLFDQFEKARTDDKKRTLAEQICQELKVHTTIEEEIFYPAARQAIEDDDLLDEAAVEHASAKELIEQIESGSPADDKWCAKVTVLGEYIQHHVKEEHNELFPEVRKTDLDLKALGEQLAARKKELMNGRGKTSRSKSRSETDQQRDSVSTH
jgi:hemerythrin-like domain-containing protein